MPRYHGDVCLGIPSTGGHQIASLNNGRETLLGIPLNIMGSETADLSDAVILLADGESSEWTGNGANVNHIVNV